MGTALEFDQMNVKYINIKTRVHKHFEETDVHIYTTIQNHLLLYILMYILVIM